MCLAIPMQLIERRGCEATAELRGVQRSVSLMLLPEAEVGDFVLVHAGYAITKIDAGEAALTLQLLDEGIAREEAAQ